MPYLIIDDFRLGMDRRKSRVSGQPGQLWLGVNGHIGRGGEFERRKKFASAFSLPTNTFGLGTVNKQLYVFGSVSTPVGMPAGVNYQQLQHSDLSTAMTKILAVTAYNGILYVVARFSDGSIFHYYDGNRVTSWDAIAASVASNNAVASALADRIDLQSAYNASDSTNVVTITAAVPGVPYTITEATINGGSINDQTVTLLETQANVAPVVETLATATLTVTGGTNNPGVNKLSTLTLDGVEILGAAVDWAVSNSDTATAIAAQITTFVSSPEYTAIAVGSIVTITATAGTGAGPNGFVLTPTIGGDATTSVSNMGGGITVVTAVAQIYTVTIGGTFEVADTFIVTLDSVPYSVSGASAGTGITALTYQQKVYSVTNSLLYFSSLNNPSQWGSGLGSGFINMANQNEGNEDLTGVQEYQGRLAVFSPSTIRVWDIDVDPNLNTFQQTVPNTGTESIRSVVPYGNIDVFYLDSSTGIRSLRARDSSNAPSVDDVGVAIDPFIKEYLDTLTEVQIQDAVGIIEPEDSRYWLAVGSRIFVFSYFRGSKINAWTYYDLTDSAEAGTDIISDLIRVDKQAYMRAGDTIFLYGGAQGTTYPADAEIEAEISFPFLSAGTPATFKGVTGFDAGVTGQWRTWLLPDPNNDTVELEVGTFSKNTFAQPRMAIEMPTSLFAMKMVCSKAGYASVANVAIHYESQKAL